MTGDYRVSQNRVQPAPGAADVLGVEVSEIGLG